MHEIRVGTVSPEEASEGVAELWAGDELIAFTHFDDVLMLRIDPRPDGAPVEVGVHSLVAALGEANRPLAADEGPKKDDPSSDSTLDRNRQEASW